MKKYIEKKLSTIEPMQGFTAAETALFNENGVSAIKDVTKNFQDLNTKSWLSKFIGEMSHIGRNKEFAKMIAENKDKVFCIVGDYDADGIMATTIMRLALETFGVKKCNFVIPDRLNDGYGIKDKHVDRAIDMGSEVIVTVDNGISANSTVDYAKSKGLKFIITDHHIPDKGNLPKADLIVNPHLTKEVNEDICGAFVAFKLAKSILDLNNKDHEYVMKDMALFAAVATISDVMPMIGENRLLVKYVLDNINFVKEKNLWVGRTLKFISGFGNSWLIKNTENIITEDTLGFYIGPTINASGRVSGETEHIVDDIVNAVNFNVFINGYREVNNERKTKTQEIFKEHVHSDDPVGFMVIDHSKYEYPIGGLIGLVANRIADKEQKPALVGTMKDDKISFSCRSIPGYSLHEGLKRFFEKYPNTTVQGGGHDGAIGIRTSLMEEVNLLKEHFSQDYKQYAVIPEQVVFAYEEKFGEEIFEAHKKLAPFGKGFNKLKFKYEGTVTSVDKNDFLVQVGELIFRAFNKEHIDQKVGTKVRVVFSVSLDSKVYDDFKIDEIDLI